MADARSFLLLDSAGAPLTTATPTFVDYRDRAGAARTPPSNPAHVGGGEYVYLPSDADETVGTVALVDAGVSATPRRDCKALHLADNSNQFFAFHVETQAGALWGGTAPTIGVYRDKLGAVRTPPALVVVAGAYLFALTPSSADVTADSSVRFDMPVGAAGAYLNGDTVPVIVSPWAAPSPGPIKNPAADLVAFLDTKLAGVTTLASGTNLFAGPMRATELTSNPAVFIANVGGDAPQPYVTGDRSAYYSPSVQVVVRGPVNDIAKGETLARGVYAWLQQGAVFGYTQVLCRESQPAYLGEDSVRRGQWVMNVSCQYPAKLS